MFVGRIRHAIMPPKPPKKSNAERMRLYQAKKMQNQVVHEEYKAAERARYHWRKTEGKLQTIYDLNDRD